MTLDDLMKTTGEWLRGEGPGAEVVISSRVRLARNLAECSFLSSASASERAEIYRTVAEAITSSTVGEDNLLVDMEEAEELDRLVLVERHLISRQHAAGDGSRGVTISPNERRAVMINEEDHLRIQSLRSGLELDTVWHEVSETDDLLGQSLDFAYDNQLGYLTACPTNVGTGIRVSVMVHLPALRLTQDIERVARAARDLRLAVRGLYGEGTEVVGDLYQISNQTTLGKSEEEIVAGFAQSIIPRIVEYEMAARKALATMKGAQLDDKIWRAYGILANARSMTNEETLALLSPLRMGVTLNRFDCLTLREINELFLFTQPAHLQKLHGREMEPEERDVVRAEYIRKRLAR